MKESEFASRLELLFEHPGMQRVRSAADPPRSLLGVPLRKIAEAAGVELEPDESRLPARLEIGAFDEQGWRICDASVADRNQRYGSSLIYILGTRGQVEALVAAYNNRPRWRTGSPPRSDFYLAQTTRSRAGLMLSWDGSYWRMPESFTLASEWRNGVGQPLGEITGWMPLPDP